MALIDDVDQAVQAARLPSRDTAAVALARRYATAIDAGGPDTLAEFGPRLLATLTALGLTLAGRGKTAEKGGDTHAGDSKPPTSPLDELRARRNQRSA